MRSPDRTRTGVTRFAVRHLTNSDTGLCVGYKRACSKLAPSLRARGLRAPSRTRTCAATFARWHLFPWTMGAMRAAKAAGRWPGLAGLANSGPGRTRTCVWDTWFTARGSRRCATDPWRAGSDGEDDGTRTRNGLAHDQAPQPFGSSSVRNQGLEPRTNCVWSSRSAAELIAHVLLPTVVGADE